MYTFKFRVTALARTIWNGVGPAGCAEESLDSRVGVELGWWKSINADAHKVVQTFLSKLGSPVCLSPPHCAEATFYFSVANRKHRIRCPKFGNLFQ